MLTTVLSILNNIAVTFLRLVGSLVGWCLKTHQPFWVIIFKQCYFKTMWIEERLCSVTKMIGKINDINHLTIYTIIFY